MSEIDKYQEGYYITEAAANAALNEIAYVHRQAGREVWDDLSPLVLPNGCDPDDCIGYLLVVDKVDRYWRWWTMRIKANEVFVIGDDMERRFMES
jgi:hypothetical protein